MLNDAQMALFTVRHPDWEKYLDVYYASASDQQSDDDETDTSSAVVFFDAQETIADDTDDGSDCSESSRDDSYEYTTNGYYDGEYGEIEFADDSDGEYYNDGDEDDEDYTEEYDEQDMPRGIEATSWASHSRIDGNGHIDLHSLVFLRRSSLAGTLSRCTWTVSSEKKAAVAMGSSGVELRLITPEDEVQYLDDKAYYDNEMCYPSAYTME